jgi:hypothetical protein
MFVTSSVYIMKIVIKVEVKLSLCLIKHYTMKTYGGGRYGSTIVDLVARWR